MSSEAQTVIGPRPTGQVLAALRNPSEALTRRVRNAAICLAAIIVAFHYSLSTLIRTLRYDTPLAYLSFVPFVAFLLAIRRLRPDPLEPAIHDRQVDYIVAAPLLLGALAIMLLMPERLSSMFWVQRYDILALPLFAAGAVALLFGVRVLARLKFPIAFLLLAWPVPYTTFLLTEIGWFTNITQSALRKLVAVIPVAKPVGSLSGTYFLVQHGKGTFPVAVVSSCSGISSVIGFALIGLAMLPELRGRAWRKALWFAIGLTLVWVLNVLRVFAVLAIGKFAGEHLALDIIHPVLGLFTFSFGILAMLFLATPLRLELKWFDRRSKGPAAEPPTPGPHRPPAVGRAVVATSVVVVVALMLGLANSNLRKFDLVANAAGQPRLVSYLERQAPVPAYNHRRIASYPWSRSLFGSNSNWYRYQYHWQLGTPATLRTTSAVLVDVISTDDLGALQTYGIEACYRFHGYDLKADKIVDLGGVYGKLVSYRTGDSGSDWTGVYWQWPVRTTSGTRWERVTITLATGAPVQIGKTALTYRDLGRVVTPTPIPGKSATETHTQQAQDFLVAFAKQLVKNQPAAA